MNLKEKKALDWINSIDTIIGNKNVKTIEDAFFELEMYRKFGTIEELGYFQKGKSYSYNKACFRLNYFSSEDNICAVITNDIQYFKLDYTAVDFPKTKDNITEIVKEIIEDVSMLIDKKGISELEHAGWLEISQKDYFDLITNHNINIFTKKFNINKYWITPALNGKLCQENCCQISKDVAEGLIINQFDINCEELDVVKKLKNDTHYDKKFNNIKQNYCNRYLEFFEKNKFFNCGNFSISYGAFPNINYEKSYTYMEII